MFIFSFRYLETKNDLESVNLESKNGTTTTLSIKTNINILSLLTTLRFFD